jgi:outer membrane lipoprotein-sorting protein
MSVRFPTLCLALLLASPLAFAQAISTPAADKGRQIVAHCISAMGGQLYLQVNQRSGNGRLYTFDSKGELANPGTPFWLYYQYPDKQRIELTKKRNVIFIYSGDKGWQITFKGVEAATASALRRFEDSTAHSLDVILKQWAQSPQTLMFYQRLTQFQQEPVDAVRFTAADGKTATIDFSHRTHLPVRLYWRETDPQTGGILEHSFVYGDWSSIGGIETPFTIDSYEGPMEVQQENFSNISFAPLPAKLFTPAYRRKR